MEPKKKWLESHVSKSNPFALRLVTFIVYSGVSLSSAFVTLLHLHKPSALTPPLPGFFHGLTKLYKDHQEYSSFGCLLLSLLKRKPSSSDVHVIVKDMLEFEKETISELLQICPPEATLANNPIGLATLYAHLENLADNCLMEMGYGKLWKVETPLPWIKTILGEDTSEKDQRSRNSVGAVKSPVKSADQAIFSTDFDF